LVLHKSEIIMELESGENQRGVMASYNRH
jgi:hypothetical protein